MVNRPFFPLHFQYQNRSFPRPDRRIRWYRKWMDGKQIIDECTSSPYKGRIPVYKNDNNKSCVSSCVRLCWVLFFWCRLSCHSTVKVWLKCFGIVHPHSIYALPFSMFRDPCRKGEAAGHHLGCNRQLTCKLVLQLVHLQAQKATITILSREITSFGYVIDFIWHTRDIIFKDNNNRNVSVSVTNSRTHHLRYSKNNNIGILSKTDLAKKKKTKWKKDSLLLRFADNLLQIK